MSNVEGRGLHSDVRTLKHSRFFCEQILYYRVFNVRISDVVTGGLGAIAPVAKSVLPPTFLALTTPLRGIFNFWGSEKCFWMPK